jgi:hypothetical protein
MFAMSRFFRLVFGMMTGSWTGLLQSADPAVRHDDRRAGGECHRVVALA